MWIWVYRYFNRIVLWSIEFLKWFRLSIATTMLQFDYKLVWSEGNLIRWFKRIKRIKGLNRKYCKVYIYLFIFFFIIM